MKEIVAAITDWPALIQAVVGAGIFSLLFYLSTKLYSAALTRVAAISEGAQLAKLKNELLRFEAFKVGLKDDSLTTHGIYAAVLWYRASRQITKALIWLTMGLVFESLIPAFGIVGFLGCLYYLISAQQVLGPVKNVDEVDAKIVGLKAQLAKLEK